MTSSSSWGWLYAWHGRLYNDIFWASGSASWSVNHWLQVEFVNMVDMVGIQTQGAPSINQWTREVAIQTGNNQTSLSWIVTGGAKKVSNSNSRIV